MLRRQLMVLACVITLAAACGKKGGDERMTSNQPGAAQPSAQMPPTPSVAATDLAGQWQLNMPAGAQQQVTITATDPTHVNIQGGGNVGGNYLVQGRHLLVLTHDERLRPLAWQIDSADALRLVRAPAAAAVGADYTGATLSRSTGAAAPAAPGAGVTPGPGDIGAGAGTAPGSGVGRGANTPSGTGAATGGGTAPAPR